MINCAIVGGSGYIGGELIKLLLGHPQVNLTAITANEMAGMPLAKVHPNFSHHGLNFKSLCDTDDADVVFMALPHGKAMNVIHNFADKIIIDTSADFRLQNEDDYENYYCQEHQAFDLVADFVYGLPELFREQITTAKHVAAPGCFATAVTLAIYPLIAEQLASSIIVNGVTGSSGSGIKPSEKAHHAFRENSYFAYEFFNHRHVPEIKQAIKVTTNEEIELLFQPHSGPFIRGIYVTAYIKLKTAIDRKQILSIYHQHYDSAPFIRFTHDVPNIKWVQHTNFCDLDVRVEGQTAIVMVAIDNLLKGGAGQAVQCFNILNGFEESLGLPMFAPNP